MEGGRRGGTEARDTLAYGTGLAPEVNVDGNTISIQGTLPEGYKAGDRFIVCAAVQAPRSPPSNGSHRTPSSLPASPVPKSISSSVKRQDGPYPVVYEAFHYVNPPRMQDLTCSVIQALGDKFDMLAYYSDFRIDNPEAGTSSDGPLGGGPAGGKVTGIAAEQRQSNRLLHQGPIPVAVHPARLCRRQPNAGVPSGRT